MPPILRSSAALVILIALLSAFALLGSRGIWDPDEGRYTNVALTMRDTGDWLVPRRNHETGHWTKPPLTYWTIAASVATFGDHPWAARLPGALAFLLCTWLAWRISQRLAPGAELQAALVYSTMLLTVGATQLITTDYVLAACVGVAALGFVEARFAATGRAWWMRLMWLGLALAFMTKGPPALVVVLPFLVYDLLAPGRQRPMLWLPSGLAIFVAVALPWYLAVIVKTPGLLGHLVGDEVVNRVASDEFGRHGEWYGWLQIYAPVLLLGTLPWTPALLRWARGLPAAVRGWRSSETRAQRPHALLLALWLLLPLAVFCIARSRMPLYLLPLFLPLAIIVARQRMGEGRSIPRWHWLALWAVLLIAIKLGGALWPSHKDASTWADAIHARNGGANVTEVIFIEDMARYGLHLHLGAQIEKVSLTDLPQPRFNPEYDGPLAAELVDHDASAIWVCKRERWPEIRDHIIAAGWTPRALGAPFEGRVLFRLDPKASR